VAGNIVDATTLRVTLNHLRAQEIEVKHGILDAGYCSGDNFDYLYDNGIPFLIRLTNDAVAKKLISEHGNDVKSAKYVLEYGERLLFIKRVKATLFGHDCFVFVAVDYDRLNDEQESYYRKVVENRAKNKQDIETEKDELGYFVMLSSEKLETSEVMPLYYMRQTIEQTFDFAKNDVALMPVRSHNNETFRGHLLLSFISTIMLINIRRVLKTRKKMFQFPAVQALRAMRFIKCDVFPRCLVTSEAGKYANLIIRELKLCVPGIINL
jgi:transposase